MNIYSGDIRNVWNFYVVTVTRHLVKNRSAVERSAAAPVARAREHAWFRIITPTLINATRVVYGIRHDTNSGVEGFFLLPFREKRSVFEKTRVKRKGGGRGDSLYKRASESCVKHSQDLFITGEGGYLETEIKLLSRYKYFVRELASKKKSLNFSVASLLFRYRRDYSSYKANSNFVACSITSLSLDLSLAHTLRSPSYAKTSGERQTRFRENMWITGSRAHS